MLIADAIYKWAPNGNPTQRNFKLQGEYFRRHENGELASATDSGSFDSTQSGWYLQGVYQFMPNWRTGLRYDRLSSGTPSIGAGTARFPVAGRVFAVAQRASCSITARPNFPACACNSRATSPVPVSPTTRFSFSTS